MFDRAFVATTVALGGTLDDALTALGKDDDAPQTLRMVGAGHDTAGFPELVSGLRSTSRADRAKALALALHDVLRAVDEGALR